MYAQIEKPKENKSRAVANSVVQKKNSAKQGFGFVDNRTEAVAQRKLQDIANNNSQIDRSKVVQKMANNTVVQRKYDHLFNDIPKTLSNLPKSLKSETITKIRGDLNLLRDDHGVDDLHAGEDQNATDFGHAQRSFLTAAEAYSHSLIGTSAMREATFTLWKYSVDSGVATSLGNVSAKVKQWHSLEKVTWEAITKHTGIGE